MDSIILSILGDILGFNSSIGPTPIKITKKKYGDDYYRKVFEYTNDNFFGFLSKGGINIDITNFKYSFNTLMLFATLKGLSDGKDYKKNCTKEYIKIYNKYGEKKLNQRYYSNLIYLESLKSISINEPIQYNPKYNDSMVLTRILPIGLLFWKKEDREKLIYEIIENISITHKDNICYFSAITLGLFISFKKNDVMVEKWGYKLVEYLLSNDFDNIIKEKKMYNTEFMLYKEDYVSMWNGYLDQTFKDGKFNLNRVKIKPFDRANYLFFLFNDPNSNEFIYGLKTEECMIIAYDSLLYSEGYWEKMFMSGALGITNNTVMGSMCGILFGLEYGINNSINKSIFKNEEWLKKALILIKNINI
jgi:ADP-ribosylglycohydrolase